MIVGLHSLPANQLPLASDVSVDAQWLPLVAVAGAVAGVWVFFKVLELIRRLLVPLVVAAVVVLLGQAGVHWPAGLDDLWPFRSAGAVQDSPEIPPIGPIIPR
jgi:hypothetical protein